MRIDPEIVGVDIVLLGDFNPTIFVPKWFFANELLPEEAAEDADLQVAHKELTSFSADWLRLQVTRERFTAGSTQAPFVLLRDLVLRVFREHLFHTPLRAFGINLAVHFLVDGFATRDRVGNTLAPPEPWGPWRERLDLDGRDGGMASLQMAQTKPEGRAEGGRVSVTIEPSMRVGRKSGRGVFVGINDHFAANADSSESAERLMATLAMEFEGSLERSEGIVDHVMSLAEARRG